MSKKSLTGTPSSGEPRRIVRSWLLIVLGFVVFTLLVAVVTMEAGSIVAFSADGVVRSTSGGFQFPDGTVQQTAASNVPATLTLQVDCAAGETLTDALAMPAEELTVEFSGSCQENLVIRQDRTRLRGVTADAEIVGVWGDVVLVHGAIDVVLETFTVRGGWGGVTVSTRGAARLEGLTVRDNHSSGVVAMDGGRAWLEGVTVEDNGVDGVGAWADSNLVFGATTFARRNGRMGVVVSGGSDAFGVYGGGYVRAEDNGGAGLLVQLGSSSQGVEIQASGNEGGVAVTGQSLFAGTVDLRNNTGAGLYIAGGGNVLFNGAVRDNTGFGVQTDAATLDMRDTTISGNTEGVVFDGARIHAYNNTISDPVDLIFGTEATFNGLNSLTGGVSCDGTVQVRGDVACSGTAHGSPTELNGENSTLLPLPASRPPSADRVPNPLSSTGQ